MFVVTLAISQTFKQTFPAKEASNHGPPEHRLSTEELKVALKALPVQQVFTPPKADHPEICLIKPELQGSERVLQLPYL